MAAEDTQLIIDAPAVIKLSSHSGCSDGWRLRIMRYGSPFERSPPVPTKESSGYMAKGDT